MLIKIKKAHKDAIIPKYATEGSGGFDLYSVEEYKVYAGQVIHVDTGLIFDIPKSLELQIRPRSNLSFKTPLRVANSPGTIHSDFKNSAKVIIENRSDNETYVIKKGELIAQGVICPIVHGIFLETNDADEQ